MSERRTVPVTTRATIQRINRKLAPDYQRLRVTRGERWRGELGDFFVVDEFHNTIAQTHVDVEALAKDMGVLRAWESKVD